MPEILGHNIHYVSCYLTGKKVRLHIAHQPVTATMETFAMYSSNHTRAGRVTRMGDRRGAYTVLVGKPEGKRITWKTKV